MRQVGRYANSNHTESSFAAYLADAVQALMVKWDRSYSVEFTAPMTYEVSPDIAERDIRPIVLMASIIYKMGNIPLASFQDGDFSWNPHKGPANPIEADRDELETYIQKIRLAGAQTMPMRGFAYVYNREAYNFWWDPALWGFIGWEAPISMI